MNRRLLLSLICCMLSFSVAFAEEEKTEKKKSTPVDLSGKYTQTMQKKLAEYDNPSLPPGLYNFGDVEFELGNGIIQLGSLYKEECPDKVTKIEVNHKLRTLHIIQGTAFGGGPNVLGSKTHVEDGTRVGEYVVHYDDKSKVEIPIVYGKDVRDWWFRKDEKAPSESKVIWENDNKAAGRYQCRVRLYMTTWKNPHPDRKVVSIDYIGRKMETAAAPFCVAMSYVK
ncbi:hypothetical protein [Gimesia algae]|uniref:Uncharacterized protein n=1 Tax=Gimesia algae TaxID=2527971 RepID=A0A517VCX7_9PLAN|nr:hypothetical protein [Gimesia algae]QDT90866.1 hypothetical protein Pan161_25200 [Gimesia algae]